MKNTTASIITIGDELLIGQVIDTNSAFIAQQLNKAGIWLNRRVAVGDVYDAIKKALDEESAISDIIIITGGLGPTADDITKPLLCEYFNGKMIVNEAALENVKDIFLNKLKRPLLDVNLKQAEVPDTCTVLQNTRGTAPGMWFEKNGKVFVSLPGVPFEMMGLIEKEVIPRLKQKFLTSHILHRTLLTAGIGESFLAEHIKEFEASLPSHIKLAYLPNYGMVRLRLTATGNDLALTEKETDNYFAALKDRVSEFLVTDKDINMETVIGQLLTERKKTVCTAESCTGGYIAHLLTANPKSSSFFTGSVVCYDARIKKEVLQVNSNLIDEEGTVNEEVARQMVTGVLNQLRSTYAIAVTGLMGPDAGDEKEPVGTTWIAVGNKNKTESRKFHFRFDRKRNIELTAINALNMLRTFILQNS